MRRRGPEPRRLHRRRARRGAARRRARRSGSACTATTSRDAEIARGARRTASAASSSTPSRRSTASRPSPPSSGVRAPVLLRVTVGVEAHTHEYIATAHEDQKFGLSLAGGQAAEAVAPRSWRGPSSSCSGCTATSARRSSTPAGFEVAARRRRSACTPQIAREHGVELPELDLGGGFGIAYTTEHDPLPPTRPRATAWPRSSSASARRRRRRACPRISVEPGRAIAGPSTFTLYEVGTVKDVDARRRRRPPLRRGRRRHERQHPHRPVRRRLLRARWPAARSDAAAGARPRRRQALRERRHRRQGRVPARRRRAPATCSPSRAPAPTAGSWPASTTTCRGRRWSPSATARPGSSCAARPSDDLLALDVG